MDHISAYFPIWDQLAAEDRSALEAGVRALHFSRGALLHTGGECTGLLLVTTGQLRAYTASEDGREITLYRLFDRDICLLSASCIMRSIQFDISISAEKDTDLLLIPSEIFRAVMERSAPLANYTNELMATRFSEVMWLIEQIMWRSLDRRLADFLLNEMAIEGTPTLKLTHEEIGNHLGSPREVVTRMLKYFQEEGLVRLSRGCIQILDPDRLHRLSNR